MKFFTLNSHEEILMKIHLKENKIRGALHYIISKKWLSLYTPCIFLWGGRGGVFN